MIVSDLILASHSPRRRELLKLIGHPFTCCTTTVDETPAEDESPGVHVTRLSELKAVTAGRTLDRGIVIGCDTVVVLNGEILGKPRSRDEALDMLMNLQGRTHTVYSGFALYDVPTGRLMSDYETTQVTMRSITEDIFLRYIETGEPLDKAGAYGIQGYGAVLISSIQGCYFNVMGLPLSRLMEALYTFSNGRFTYFGSTVESHR